MWIWKFCKSTDLRGGSGGALPPLKGWKVWKSKGFISFFFERTECRKVLSRLTPKVVRRILMVWKSATAVRRESLVVSGFFFLWIVSWLSPLGSWCSKRFNKQCFEFPAWKGQGSLNEHSAVLVSKNCRIYLIALPPSGPPEALPSIYTDAVK